MKKSIYKFVSLCLAMGMILSTLAMPALAAERAVHFHSYENIGKTTNTYYYDNDYHCTLVQYTLRCSCGNTIIEEEEILKNHIPAGFGTFDHSITDNEGNTVNYYSYTCKVCGGTFVIAE